MKGKVIGGVFAAAMAFLGFRFWQDRVQPPSPPYPGVTTTYVRTGLISHTSYPVTITRRTPAGIAVDDPKRELSDDAIDGAVRSVEACLPAMPAEWSTGQAARYAGNCKKSKVPRTVDRRGFVVKVAPDWRVSKCTGEQLFPCTGDDIRDGCLAKVARKEIPPITPECPCACRHSVQNDVVAVVTPKANLLKAAISMIVTGCENPWFPPLSICAD